jgi:hypothetical protein
MATEMKNGSQARDGYQNPVPGAQKIQCYTLSGAATITSPYSGLTTNATILTVPSDAVVCRLYSTMATLMAVAPSSSISTNGTNGYYCQKQGVELSIPCANSSYLTIKSDAAGTLFFAFEMLA